MTDVRKEVVRGGNGECFPAEGGGVVFALLRRGEGSCMLSGVKKVVFVYEASVLCKVFYCYVNEMD